ncbi:MAG: lysylphosphatidylglycerol synthase domain-containing protein [Demequina sp.]
MVVVGVVAYFFWRALSDNWASLEQTDLSPGWWAVWSTLLFVVAVGLSGWLWGRIVGRLDQRPLGATEGVRVHFGSWLLKYVPGQAGFVVNKVLWGKKRGTSRVLVLISVVYENAFLLLGSTVPMIAILLVARTTGESIPSAVWLTIAAVVPLAVLTHPVIFRAVVGLLARRTLKRDIPSAHFLSTRHTWRYQLAYLAPRIVNGVGVVFIAVALADATPESWIPLAAAYAIAGAIGIVAVFVPSGLGVRESAFVLFATPYLGLEQAIIVSLAARVLATAADVIIAAVYGVLTALKKRREGIS